MTINRFILPATAGGFIYVALTNVMPELLKKSSVMQIVAEVLAILLGIFLMILIGEVEEATHSH